MPRRPAARVRAVVLIGAAVIALAGCVPEPDVTPTASVEPGQSADPAPTATVEATPSATPEASLPERCEAIYSPAMLAVLEREIPPLGDPAVTMLSTQDTTGLELLDSGIPTLRCSWGPPSDRGMSTNVSLIDGEGSAALQQSLRESGYICEDSPAGTVCTVEERGVDLDDSEYVLGEVHAFPAGGWVATRWINYLPEGYTDDILATVWG